MRRYVFMLAMVIVLAVWIPVILAPWIIEGPRRMIGRVR